MDYTYDTIKQIKETTPRNNYIFLRRRVDRGDSKKTLGWILTTESSEETYESVDFETLYKKQKELEGKVENE